MVWSMDRQAVHQLATVARAARLGSSGFGLEFGVYDPEYFMYVTVVEELFPVNGPTGRVPMW